MLNSLRGEVDWIIFGKLKFYLAVKNINIINVILMVESIRSYFSRVSLIYKNLQLYLNKILE